MAVRRLLHASGERYRVCLKIPGCPRRTIDIAFTRAKVAVFIDGCFWHGCPEHGQTPSSNTAWWVVKIEKNRTRDADSTNRLEQAGWQVLRYWEHESPSEVASSIATALSERRSRLALTSGAPRGAVDPAQEA
jgi:DNA mismatch endonuclease (patch repair protein)